ncbi:nucleotidyltransferase family protein [Nostoc sp. UHCC 0251]|uniref:nucleotidyltransferase family protein n=1 Tax=Nostoc sp. UHCC 0251 TaxID=3110240 RepID=UPI002B1F1B84|nr:nucleotidyltransferase family protein [Nostoc sp. UHCC 0251]MEA5628053.1 nucleotidyltransferase family protein [Nostoc sp. UHCC 0251]
MKQTEAIATIGVLILAAGASTRLGKPKQLLQYQGQSFLRHTAKIAIASGCQPVVVVLGAQTKQLRSQLSDLPVTIMENHDWATGISSSIHVGLEALQTQCHMLEAAIITLCDQPLISVRLIQQLVEQYRLKGKRIVTSAYAGTVGVPALFDLTLFPDLMLLQGDVGAKRLIHQLIDEVVPVSFPDGAIDIDTPLDYERFLAGLKQNRK